MDKDNVLHTKNQCYFTSLVILWISLHIII